MCREIENPMVIDAHWKPLEEPKVFGECAGCKEDIVGGNDFYEIKTTNEVLKVHQNPECCQQFVAEMAWCRTAGEE
jgi:hypothetical protein